MERALGFYTGKSSPCGPITTEDALSSHGIRKVALFSANRRWRCLLGLTGVPFSLWKPAYPFYFCTKLPLRTWSPLKAIPGFLWEHWLFLSPPKDTQGIFEILSCPVTTKTLPSCTLQHMLLKSAVRIMWFFFSLDFLVKYFFSDLALLFIHYIFIRQIIKI